MGQSNLGSHSYKRFFYHLQFHKKKNIEKNYELFSWISRIQKDLAVVSFDKYAHSSLLCC